MSSPRTTPFYHMLALAFERRYDSLRPKESFAPFLKEGIRLQKQPKGHSFIHSGLSLEKIHLLLEGKCYIVKYTLDGKSIIADTMYPIQLFGLYEMLHHHGAYRATVTAATDCWVLEIPATHFSRALEEDNGVALLTLEYLAGVVEQSIQKSDRNLFHTRLQNLVLYLHQQCQGKTLPHRLPVSRKQLSEELGLNLRTLYRQLDKLITQGLVHIQRGKLVVDEEEYVRLSQFAEELGE